MHAHADKDETKIFKKNSTYKRVPNNSLQRADTFSFLEIYFTLLFSGKHRENPCFSQSEVCRSRAEAFLTTVRRAALPVGRALRQNHFCLHSLGVVNVAFQSNVFLRSKSELNVFLDKDPRMLLSHMVTLLQKRKPRPAQLSLPESEVNLYNPEAIRKCNCVSIVTSVAKHPTGTA